MIAWIRSEIARMPVLYAALLAAAAAAGVYANTLDAGFHYDDGHHIVDNGNLRDLGNVGDFFTRPDMFSGNESIRMYRPLLLTTFALNYQWGGYRPLPWRLTALALHAFGAVGVLLAFYRLALTLQPEGKAPALAGAVAAALLFAVHPVFSETVDYASARSSLLATALLVWALYCHLEALRADRAWWRTSLLVLSLALFAGALLAKEIAIVYPALLVALAFLRKEGYAHALPAVALCALYLFARDMLLGNAVISLAPRPLADADPYDGGRRPISWNLFTQARVLLAYLALLVQPHGMNVDRHVRVSESPWEFGVLLGVAAAAGLCWAAWRVRRTHPLAALGIVWFLVALTPTSTIIPLNVIMNEHRLYLPGVGFVLAAGACAGPWLARGGAGARGAAAAVLGILALLTLHRNEDWRDPVRLWEASVGESPRSHAAWVNLGNARRVRGEFQPAREAYERALALRPGLWEAHQNLGTLLLHEGRDRDDESLLEESERHLAIAADHPRGDAQRSLWCLAETRLALGKEAEARRIFEKLARMGPFWLELTRYSFARAALDDGDAAAARAYYLQALSVARNPVEARIGLAEVALAEGDAAAAAGEALAAAAERPDDPRPYVWLARHAGGRRAAKFLFEAQMRGYVPTAAERREILGEP